MWTWWAMLFVVLCLAGCSGLGLLPLVGITAEAGLYAPVAADSLFSRYDPGTLDGLMFFFYPDTTVDSTLADSLPVYYQGNFSFWYVNMVPFLAPLPEYDWYVNADSSFGWFKWVSNRELAWTGTGAIAPVMMDFPRDVPIMAARVYARRLGVRSGVSQETRFNYKLRITNEPDSLLNKVRIKKDDGGTIIQFKEKNNE